MLQQQEQLKKYTVIILKTNTVMNEWIDLQI